MVPPGEDCFYKLAKHFETQNKDSSEVSSKMAVLHSRYASSKGVIKDSQAHPILDKKQNIALFHNGFISNFRDLKNEVVA